MIRKTPGRGFGTEKLSVRTDPKRLNWQDLLCRIELMLHTIPSKVHAKQSGESHQGMSHKGDTTALGSAAEEGDLDLVLAQSLGEAHSGLPGSAATGILVVLNGGEVGAESGVSLDDATEANLEQGNKGWAKVPKCC